MGINLTAANYVFLMEPFLNPALEEQAVGRAWRMGQKREVTVKRFYLQVRCHSGTTRHAAVDRLQKCEAKISASCPSCCCGLSGRGFMYCSAAFTPLWQGVCPRSYKYCSAEHLPPFGRVCARSYKYCHPSITPSCCSWCKVGPCWLRVRSSERKPQLCTCAA